MASERSYFDDALKLIGRSKPVDQGALSLLRNVPTTLEPYVIVALHEVGAPTAADYYCKVALKLVEASAVHEYLWEIDQAKPVDARDIAQVIGMMPASEAAIAARARMEAARAEAEQFSAACRAAYDRHVDHVYAMQQTFP